jgi:hypothetical protein
MIRTTLSGWAGGSGGHLLIPARIAQMVACLCCVAIRNVVLGISISSYRAHRCEGVNSLKPQA